MAIRTLIVDDEPPARRRIRQLLDAEPDIECVGECDSGTEALRVLADTPVDLLFLDIRMPGADGFEVLARKPSGVAPVVIFVSAFPEHALDAFGVRATDYLLKPFGTARFRAAMEAARAALARRQETISSPAAYPRRLTIPDNNRLHIVRVEDIDRVESAGNYAIVHCGRETRIWRETLSRLEARLDPARFLRISRGVIVNMDRIRELRGSVDGGHEVVLDGGVCFGLTRGLREVRARLEFS